MAEILLDELSTDTQDEGLFARDVDGQLIRLEQATAADYDKDVTLTIDGRSVTVKKAVPATDSQGNILRDSAGRTIPRRTTIFDAARQLFVKRPGDRNPIPVLCHQEHLRPVAVCRVCVVDVYSTKSGRRQGANKLLPSCQHQAEDGMEVHTLESKDEKAQRRVRDAVGLLVEMLASDHLTTAQWGSLKQPDSPLSANELLALARRLGIQSTRFSAGSKDVRMDESSPVIQVDHASCILCDRCVRACDDVKQNFVIGRTGKGYQTSIGFDLNDPMGKSSCVSCGECMISCPTDALTFRQAVLSSTNLPPGRQRIDAAELKQHPLFAGIPLKFLQWNAASVLRWRLKPSEVLCREGEYGATAFILVSGSYELAVHTPQSRLHSKRGSGLFGLLGRIATSIVPGSTASESRNPAGTSHGRTVAVRTADDVILGEMTCLSHYPRSATVVAREDCVVLEIQRNVLHMLQRNPVSRELLNRVYRERALASQLRNMDLLSGLDDLQQRECMEFLRDKVDLAQVEPGQVIFRQGEPAEDFFLVRLGFVKVSQTFLGQERVLNYQGPGSYFGEIGLLSGLSDLIGEAMPTGFRGLRTATCSALDDVELVRIKGEHFRELIRRYDALRESLVARASELLKENARQQRTVGQPLDAFLEQGLFNARKLLVLDLESCTRCDECTRACADTHDGVTRLIREGLRFDHFLVASSCRSCLDPYCLVGCPVDAIHRKNSQEIRIEDHCIGCGQCAKNCPYGNINMHGFADTMADPARPGRQIAVTRQKATTCDLCRHVVGPQEDPSCVYACPHHAAFRMSGQELIELVRQEGQQAMS